MTHTSSFFDRLRRQRPFAGPLPRWASRLALVVIVGMTQGCVLPPQGALSRGMESGCDTEVSPADKTRLAAIEQMISEGKAYAALAQIETLRSQAPLVRLTRAEALRRTEVPEQAGPVYAGLLDTCHKGRAHHGLGLLLARQGDGAGSLSHLQSARAELPTDPRVRNDLGFALLLAGRLPEARFEFLTTLDLDPGDTRAARNLIMLTFKQGDAEAAEALGGKLGLDKATMDKLSKQAAELPTGLAPLPQPAPAGSAPTP